MPSPPLRTSAPWPPCSVSLPAKPRKSVIAAEAEHEIVVGVADKEIVTGRACDDRDGVGVIAPASTSVGASVSVSPPHCPRRCRHHHAGEHSQQIPARHE